MTLSVLTQVSVDKLRAQAKAGETLVDRAFDDLVSEYSLTMVEVDYELDTSVQLKKPEGSRQEENKDAENCLLIASALPLLTEINATDERLWVTLCLRDFSDYAIARWPIPEGEDAKPAFKHWFARGNRAYMVDNAIGRLWWYHRQAYRVDSANVSEVLSRLFFNSDYRASIFERPFSSSNSNVLRAIIAITRENEDKGITYRRDSHREFMKNVNLLGGRARLAVLDESQLKTRLEPLYLKAYGAI